MRKYDPARIAPLILAAGFALAAGIPGASAHIPPESTRAPADLRGPGSVLTQPAPTKPLVIAERAAADAPIRR